jgi:hypothetical protein
LVVFDEELLGEFSDSGELDEELVGTSSKCVQNLLQRILIPRKFDKLSSRFFNFN